MPASLREALGALELALSDWDNYQSNTDEDLDEYDFEDIEGCVSSLSAAIETLVQKSAKHC